MSPSRYEKKTALLIGAGGLGCPAGLALAEAGIGRLILVDPDTVALSNLQRQVLFTIEDIGRPKVAAAAEHLRARFPGTEIVARRTRFDPASADALLAGGDVVIDATDDPAARFIANDRALALGIPAVIGGVVRFEGIVQAVAPGHSPCFRCVFESPPAPGEVQTCAAAGVLGAMAGVVGHIEAERALGLLDGRADELTGFITRVDGLRGRIRRVILPADASCHACAGRAPSSLQPRPVPSHQPSHGPSHREALVMSVKIKIPSSLRKFVGGHDTVEVDGSNVRDALDSLEDAHPGIKAKICDDGGNLRRFINVYADQEDIRFLDNLDTPLSEGGELQIVPAIAGGR